MAAKSSDTIVLLVQLQRDAASITPASSSSHRHSQSARSSLFPVLAPLAHEHLTVSVDPLQPVHVLHSRIEVKYAQLLQQERELHSDEDEGEALPSTTQSVPAATSALPSDHHVRVRRLLKERLYAISRLDVIGDVLQHGEQVLAEVKLRDGPLPSPPQPEPLQQKQQEGTAAVSAALSPAPTPVAEAQEAKEQKSAEAPLPSTSSRTTDEPASSTERKASKAPAVSDSAPAAASSSADPAYSSAAAVAKTGVPASVTEQRIAALAPSDPPPPPSVSAPPAASSTAPSPSSSVAPPKKKRGRPRKSHADGLPPSPAPAPVQPVRSDLLSAFNPSREPPPSRVAVSIKAVECALCGQGGGALKRTREGAWCHLVCARWTSGSEFNARTQLVHGVPRALKKAAKRTCGLCKRPRGTSAPLQCGEEQCPTNFHLTCAQQQGLQTAHVDFLDSGSSELVAYCKAHLKNELRDWVDDGCAICQFMRPDEPERSPKLSCLTCGLAVHASCYYGEESDAEEQPAAHEKAHKKRRKGDAGFDWEHWMCMRCEFVQSGLYRFPQHLPKPGQLVLPNGLTESKADGQQREAKEEHTNGKEQVQQDEEKMAGAGGVNGGEGSSIQDLRGRWRKKRKRGPHAVQESKEGTAVSDDEEPMDVDSDDEREEAEAEEKQEEKEEPQPSQSTKSAAASASPPLDPAKVRGSTPEAAPPSSSTNGNVNGHAQPPSKKSAKKALQSSGAAAGPPTSSDPARSAASPSSARYLSDARASAGTPPPAVDIQSPQTVLKALKNGSRSPSPTPVARAEYTTRVGALDAATMRAVLHHHGLSSAGGKGELIARLQASMVELPHDAAERDRWRRERQQAIESKRATDERKDDPDAAAHAEAHESESKEAASSTSSVRPEASAPSSTVLRSPSVVEPSTQAQAEMDRLRRQAMEIIESASEGEADSSDAIEDDDAMEKKKSSRPTPPRGRGKPNRGRGGGPQSAGRPLHTGGVQGTGAGVSTSNGRGRGAFRGRGRGRRIAGF